MNILEKLKAINYKSKKAVICYIIAGVVIVSGGIGTYFAIDYYKTQQVLSQIELQAQTKADEITDKISKLDYNNLTLDDEQAVIDILNEYNELDENTKSKVTNFGMLKNCEEKIETLKIEEEEKVKAQEEEKQRQEEEASRISAEIDKIPQTVSLAYENTINILKEQYNALSDEAKALVINWGRIAEIEQQINQLKQNNVSTNNSNAGNGSTTTSNSNNTTNGANTSNNNSGSSSNSGVNNNTTNNNTTNQNQATTTPQRTWEYMADLSRQTFNLMNSFRQQNGVPALTWNETCNARAKSVAEDCASREVIYHNASEISLGNGVGTAQSFINQWANSAGHKESMLQSLYTAGAVAVYKDSNGRYYVIADFYNELFG